MWRQFQVQVNRFREHATNPTSIGGIYGNKNISDMSSEINSDKAVAEVIFRFHLAWSILWGVSSVEKSTRSLLMSPSFRITSSQAE